MCLGSSPSPPPPPPAPPPPPPVLEQSAPSTSAPKQAEALERRASGTKKYRTSFWKRLWPRNRYVRIIDD
jgi:hypothetical protein